MRARIHETALYTPSTADGRLCPHGRGRRRRRLQTATRSVSAAPVGLRLPRRGAVANLRSVQMLVNHGDQPVMQKAQLGGGLPVFELQLRAGVLVRGDAVALPRRARARRAGSHAPNATAFPVGSRARARRGARGELAVPDHTLSLDAPHAPAAEGALDCAAAPGPDGRAAQRPRPRRVRARAGRRRRRRARARSAARRRPRRGGGGAVASGENYAPFATHGPKFRRTAQPARGDLVVAAARALALRLGAAAAGARRRRAAQRAPRAGSSTASSPTISSDLVARIEWLRADDDRARRLAESALRVGRQAVTADAVACFFARGKTRCARWAARRGALPERRQVARGGISPRRRGLAGPAWRAERPPRGALSLVS